MGAVLDLLAQAPGDTAPAAPFRFADWGEVLLSQGRTLFDQACHIWITGGWCMVPIAIAALLLFGLGTHVYLRLRRANAQAVPEATWRRWIDDRQQRRGRMGELLDYVTRGGSLPQMQVAFAEVRAAELAPFERDLRVIRVCIAAAPLLGLLGTVTGMLATFQALASGSGGDQTMDLVAKGISEALITTETGLVVALPGVLLQYQLARGYQRFRVFLAHVETVCTQGFFKRARTPAVPAVAGVGLAEN